MHAIYCSSAARNALSLLVTGILPSIGQACVEGIQRWLECPSGLSFPPQAKGNHPPAAAQNACKKEHHKHHWMAAFVSLQSLEHSMLFTLNMAEIEPFSNIREAVLTFNGNNDINAIKVSRRERETAWK